VERSSSTLGGGVATITAQEGANAPRDACPRCGARRVDNQLGLEASPDLYVERMVAVFREVWRVLRDDGTVWLNLGDSYAASGGDDHSGSSDGKVGRGDRPDQRRRSGLKPKDLVGIPWRVAFALQADGWTLRSDIIWSKPNPMPESVTDRPTKAHEYVFLLSKRPRYFYDADAIREPAFDAGRVNGRDGRDEDERARPPGSRPRTLARLDYTATGRNRRSVWTIATEPFPEAHFATYPQALVQPCILAGTSEHGECVECGAPWVRVVERGELESTEAARISEWDRGKVAASAADTGRAGALQASGFKPNHVRPSTTTGWRASCQCDAPTRPQLVLDPFIGSGTTALVARHHGRRCIGIDLSAEYLEIAAKRTQQLGLFGSVA